MMKTHIFATYCLAITVAFSLFFGEAKEFFNSEDLYEFEIAGLKKHLERERFKHMITFYEFEDFRAHVGSVLPEHIENRGKGEKSYPLRTLASVVQKSNGEEVRVIRAKSLFEKAKNNFRSGQYTRAIQMFQKLIKKHAYSVYINESMFLIVESHFRLREYDAVTEWVNRMLEIYPESELTGYALIRLGKVYENRDRHDDAIEIYRTVLKVFPSRDLASLAKTSLRATEL